jgi:hypothetical protein
MNIQKFLDLNEGEQAIAVARMTPAEHARLKNEFTTYCEKIKLDNLINIKLTLAKQFADETKDRIRSFKGETK